MDFYKKNVQSKLANCLSIKITTNTKIEFKKNHKYSFRTDLMMYLCFILLYQNINSTEYFALMLQAEKQIWENISGKKKNNQKLLD